MGFKKPFRAVPITLGARYRAIDLLERWANVWRTLTVAAVVGVVIGIASEFAAP